MMLHYKRINMVILAFVTAAQCFWCSCRNPRQQPSEILSDEQLKMSDVMNASANQVEKTTSLYAELEKLAAEYSRLTGDSMTLADQKFSRQLDSAALRLSSGLFMETDPVKIVNALNNCIFGTWGVTFNSNRDNMEYLWPTLVFKNRQGSCIGMSLMYLLLAEKLDLPLYGVLAPGHFFIRFDNGSVQINIETLRKGECMPAAWYRQKYSITDTLLYPLHNLSVEEVAGVVCYNLGTICFHEKKYDEAVVYLQRASSSCRNFPEAAGNCALALDARGDSEKALEMLVGIKKKYPAFDNIDNNIASLQLKCGMYEAALATYTVLCQKQSENAQFHYGRGVALLQLNQTGEAAIALQKAVEISPGFMAARELLQKTGFN